MGELINNDNEFKTPTDRFVQDLESLEKYNIANSDNIARMSLFNQFDPLVAQSKTSNSPSFQTNNNINSKLSEDILNETTEKCDESNISGTLIQINTPSKQLADLNSINNANTNGVEHANKDQQISEANKEIGILESENETLELLIGQLSLFNQDIVQLTLQNFNSFQEIIDSGKKEEAKLVAIKSQLEEDINSVEKSYYDIHSRYENLRTFVKEMDNRESQNKLKMLELSSKLKEKEHECRKWRNKADEIAESANQRIQNAAKNESVSLKAQMKVLEMKVNSLQSQIEQKNIENEELSHIVEELIANRKN